MENEMKKNGFAIASLVLGIIGLLTFWIPIIGIFCPILSTVFGFTAKKNSTANAGKLIGLISLIFSIAITIYALCDVLPDMQMENKIGNEIVSESPEKDDVSNVIGTWYGAGSTTDLQNGNYTVVFTLDNNYNFG